eukprot:3453054-Prymnesium_polylepis.1
MGTETEVRSQPKRLQSSVRHCVSLGNLATCWQPAGNLCWQSGNPGLKAVAAARAMLAVLAACWPHYVYVYVARFGGGSEPSR